MKKATLSLFAFLSAIALSAHGETQRQTNLSKMTEADAMHFIASAKSTDQLYSRSLPDAPIHYFVGAGGAGGEGLVINGELMFETRCKVGPDTVQEDAQNCRQNHDPKRSGFLIAVGANFGLGGSIETIATLSHQSHYHWGF